MKNRTTNAILTAVILGATMLASPAGAAQVKIPPQVDPGAIMKHNIDNFNQCSPHSPYYRGYPCNGIVTAPGADIQFMNANDEPVTLDEFVRLVSPVREAREIHVNPDGSIELK